MEPKLIKKKKMTLSGLWGDGRMTAGLWQDFEEKADKSEFQAADNCGWEIRTDGEIGRDCFVGFTIDEKAPKGFQTATLPTSEYAVFDVVVANGYTSENANMNAWLEEKRGKYMQAELDGKKFVLECYNGRFQQGIVEVWIPLNKI
jgi:predicted transcriptional regulator YdeE